MAGTEQLRRPWPRAEQGGRRSWSSLCCRKQCFRQL